MMNARQSIYVFNEEVAMPPTTNAIPRSVSIFMQRITELCGTEHADWAENFNTCFANTLTTTVRRHDDGTTFLLTGDIPAMWLRDSSAQFRPYLVIAQDDPDMADLIAGLVRQQFRFINIDPYANAFNETPSGATWDPDDRTDSFGPWLWERKYEVDSLCYPIQLAWLLYRNTGLTSHFDESFVSACVASLTPSRPNRITPSLGTGSSARTMTRVIPCRTKASADRLPSPV